MRNRIAMWASVGFLLASLWALFAFLAGPAVNISADPVLWTLVQWTCPIVFVGTYFHFGVHLAWVLVSNAVAYGLLGWIVETFRQTPGAKIPITMK